MAKLFVSFVYANAQVGGFNFAHSVVEVENGRMTQTLIEDIATYLGAEYKNKVVILSIIPLEPDESLTESDECDILE